MRATRSSTPSPECVRLRSPTLAGLGWRRRCPGPRAGAVRAARASSQTSSLVDWQTCPGCLRRIWMRSIPLAPSSTVRASPGCLTCRVGQCQCGTMDTFLRFSLEWEGTSHRMGGLGAGVLLWRDLIWPSELEGTGGERLFNLSPWRRAEPAFSYLDYFPASFGPPDYPDDHRTFWRDTVLGSLVGRLPNFPDPTAVSVAKVGAWGDIASLDCVVAQCRVPERSSDLTIWRLPPVLVHGMGTIICDSRRSTRPCEPAGTTISELRRPSFEHLVRVPLSWFQDPEQTSAQRRIGRREDTRGPECFSRHSALIRGFFCVPLARKTSGGGQIIDGKSDRCTWKVQGMHLEHLRVRVRDVRVVEGELWIYVQAGFNGDCACVDDDPWQIWNGEFGYAMVLLLDVVGSEPHSVTRTSSTIYQELDADLSSAAGSSSSRSDASRSDPLPENPAEKGGLIGLSCLSINLDPSRLPSSDRCAREKGGRLIRQLQLLYEPCENRVSAAFSNAGASARRWHAHAHLCVDSFGGPATEDIGTSSMYSAWLSTEERSSSAGPAVACWPLDRGWERCSDDELG